MESTAFRPPAAVPLHFVPGSPLGFKRIELRRRAGPGRSVQLASIQFAEGRTVPASADQGAVAQLGERLICTQEAVGSIPISSTSLDPGPVAQVARAHP